LTAFDLELFGNDVLVLGVGFAVLYALGLARRLGDVRLVGLGFLAGWAAVGLATSAMLMLGIPVRLPTILIAAACLVATGALVGRRTAGVGGGSVAQSRRPLAVAAVCCGFAIVAVEAVAALVVSLTNWDAETDFVNFWGPRAATIYYYGGVHPSTWGDYAHEEYPPLGPAMNAVTFHFVHGFHPSLLPVQQVLLGIAFLLAAFALLDRYTPRWISVPSLALLVTAPWFWWHMQSLLPDQTLAYLLSIAALASVFWLLERRGQWLGLAVLFLGAGALLKLEGSLFGILLVLVVLAAGFLRFRSGAVPAFALLLGPLAVLPWRLWLYGHSLRSSAADYSLSDLASPGYLADRISRAHRAVDTLARAGAHDSHAAAILCLLVVALIAAATRKPLIAGAVAVWMGLMLAGLVAIYWIGRMQIDFYLNSSDARVGATVLIAAATMAPLLFGLALETGERRERARPLQAGRAPVIGEG
jgi:hypothetical protein